MASAAARAYIGGLGAEPLAGSRGRAPGRGQGAKPPEAEAFLTFWMSNGCNKFAPFAVFLVCSRFKQPATEQVAQLSLTNPRDALHHDKRQNFKPVTWPQPHPFVGDMSYPVVRIDIVYLCTKLTTLGSAVPVIWLDPPKFVMGHMTWPRNYQGLQFVVLGSDLHIQPLHQIYCLRCIRQCKM